MHAAGYGDLRVAINLSGQEFSRADLVARVAAILQGAHVDASRLDIEIKEQMLYRDALQNHATCRDLKSIGVGIVIDDFGTGASMLAHLSHSLVDAIKLDMSFVAKIETSDRDRAACAAAIALAHGLGVRAVAEGVETDAQAEFLHENGCDWLQGYLFSRPLASAELIPYLDEAARAGSRRVSIK